MSEITIEELQFSLWAKNIIALNTSIKVLIQLRIEFLNEHWIGKISRWNVSFFHQLLNFHSCLLKAKMLFPYENQMTIKWSDHLYEND